MRHVSAQGVDERMINVLYYYNYETRHAVELANVSVRYHFTQTYVVLFLLQEAEQSILDKYSHSQIRGKVVTRL